MPGGYELSPQLTMNGLGDSDRLAQPAPGLRHGDRFRLLSSWFGDPPRKEHPMTDLTDGEKEPNETSGAPYAPAKEHHDGQRDRSPLQVPSSTTARPEHDDEVPTAPTEGKQEEERHGR